jgi:hypothetical protein
MPLLDGLAFLVGFPKNFFGGGLAVAARKHDRNGGPCQNSFD